MANGCAVLKTLVVIGLPKLSNIELVSTWVGDRLGTPRAVGTSSQ